MADKLQEVWINEKLSKREVRLLRAWNERVHAVSIEEDKPVDWYDDALPILVGLAVQMYPMLSLKKRMAMLSRVTRVQRNVLDLSHGEMKGRA